MYNFLVRILAMFIPVRSWRHAFRKKMNRNAAFGDLENVFTEIKIKRDTVLKNKDICETIILGSSHGAYGINPEFIRNDCFNLCTNSQDLFTAEHVFDYMKKELPHLKNVILIIDVFTRGWCLERTSAKHICASYQYLYGFKYPMFQDEHNYLKQCKKLDRQHLHTTENKNGYLNPPKLLFTDTVESRVNAHMREHNRKESQYHSLKNIVNSTSCEKEITFSILILPTRSDYKKLLPDNLVLNEVKQIIKGTNVKIFDFSNDPDFKDEDFYDYDHLNPHGAEKLSKKLKGKR